MIGKQLNERVSSWTVDNFQPILNVQFPILPDEAIENLSSDQYYALQMRQGVIKGIVDTDLKYLEVGGLCHSRWLTLGCRVLRYYSMFPKANHQETCKFWLNTLFGYIFHGGFALSSTTELPKVPNISSTCSGLFPIFQMLLSMILV